MSKKEKKTKEKSSGDKEGRKEVTGDAYDIHHKSYKAK